MESSAVLDKYMDASNDASKRTLKLVLLVIFSCVVAFIYYWNARAESWFSIRYSSMIMADAIMHPDDTLVKDFTVKPIYKLSDGNVVYLKKFLNNREINSATAFKDYKDIFRDGRSSQYKCSIPILGISFDINDLCLFSGITLLVFLFLSFSSLHQEHMSTQTSFEESQKSALLTYAYKYMSLRQHLVYPPTPQNERFNAFYNSLVRLIFLLPVIVQTISLIRFATEVKNGIFIQSDNWTAFNVAYLCINCAISIAITILSIACFRKLYIIYTLYCKYYESVKTNWS